MKLIKIKTLTGDDHFINPDMIVEFDPHIPNMEMAVGIELSNGRRIIVHRMVANLIIDKLGEIVLDTVEGIVHNTKTKGTKNG